MAVKSPTSGWMMPYCVSRKKLGIRLSSEEDLSVSLCAFFDHFSPLPGEALRPPQGPGLGGDDWHRGAGRSPPPQASRYSRLFFARRIGTTRGGSVRAESASASGEWRSSVAYRQRCAARRAWVAGQTPRPDARPGADDGSTEDAPVTAAEARTHDRALCVRLR